MSVVKSDRGGWCGHGESCEKTTRDNETAVTTVPGNPSEFTHDYLVNRAEEWLYKRAGCWFVITDAMRTQNREHPDAIGWLRDGISVLVECKKSRKDFLGDVKKNFRVNPEEGMGAHRFFMCPPGVINPEDVPEGWYLLWCYPSLIMLKKKPDNLKQDSKLRLNRPVFKDRNLIAENIVLSNALRRLNKRGVFSKIYDKIW